MKKKIEDAIKALTDSKKIVSLEEICDYINEECYKEFKREYYYNVDILIDETENAEFMYKIEDDAYTYFITKCHIEVSEVGKRPLILEWYMVEKLDDDENILNMWYFI